MEQPDARAVTRRQAEYLAQITDYPAEKLAGRPIAELGEILKWRIDPELLFFRKICGRVVRVDPITHVIQGVPNATVHVEDTDCSFLGFFPVEGPWIWWWWLWPIFCHREEIATVQTDACGRFCVWVPRWDIDRILRFRRERVCLPDIVKPNLRDIIGEIVDGPWPPIRVNPNPPDPPPFELPDRAVLERAGEMLGRDDLARLAAIAGRREFGAQDDQLGLLDSPAFLDKVAPPLHDKALKRLEHVHLPHGEQREHKAFAKLDVDLSAARAVGPFLRCRDVIVAEWVPVLDVPDITFRVTQDVDLDGDEETIYSEGFFDVRWNAGPIPDVTLHASPIARPSHACEGPSIPCGNEPAIVTVGLMPLANTHHDNGTGTATRVNRPRPGGLLTDPQVSPGQAPYAGTLQLHGCQAIEGAQFYRLLYDFEGAGEVPFLGQTWFAPLLTGPPWWTQVGPPDGNGWYPVPSQAELDNLVFPHWLLNWPTTEFANGRYVVRMELADGSKNPLSGSAQYSDPVTFAIDNSRPSIGFSGLRWRVSGGAWTPVPFPFTCVVIERPTGHDIEIEVDWGSSAVHLRDAEIGFTGCGGGTPTLLSSLGTSQHWHQNFGDNAVSRTTRFGVGAADLQGAYSFGISAWSRAFNPAGDGGGPSTNWLTNYSYIYSYADLKLAIIDA